MMSTWFFIITMMEGRINELAFVEELQVFHALSQTDILHRHLQLVADTYHHSTFCRSVEFGDSHAGDLCDSRELLGLFEGILPRTAIKHEHYLVGSIGQHLLHHVLHLLQLIHQTHLIMQAPCGIDDDHIGLIGLCRTQGIESHGGRVGPHLLFDDGHSHALTPNAELLHGGSTEGIGSTKKDLLACLFELISQFADSGSLSHSVNAYHENNIGFVVSGQIPVVVVGGVVLGKQCRYLLAQDSIEFGSGDIFVSRYPLFDTLDDFHGGVNPNIGRDEHLFQFVEHFVVDL